MPQRSDRLDRLPPYVFSVIGDRIRQMQKAGKEVIRLDIGDPDMPPPDFVVDVMTEAIHSPGNHGYSGYRGLAAFRVAIADYYQQRFGVSLDPDTQVLPLIGSKEGIVNLMLAYIGSGDGVLIPDIGYPSYSQGTLLTGGDIHWMPLNEDNDFIPSMSDISPDVARKSKLMWVNYPNNPTGQMVGVDFYKTALEFCREHDILLASDNPYMDITFDQNVATSALQDSPDDLNDVVEFFSFSKSFNMAGWRLGAAVGSADAIKNLLAIKSNVDSGHFKAIYQAGIYALTTPQEWIDSRNAIYKRRRDLLLSALPEIGLSAKASKGSLYVWAKVENESPQAYIEAALEHACVSLAPGAAYGPGGDDYIRMSIGIPDHELDRALDSLKRWYTTR